MGTTPHYRYQCESCGVGLTDELAFRDGERVACPHCYRGRRSGAGAGRVWVDAGLPVE